MTRTVRKLGKLFKHSIFASKTRFHDFYISKHNIYFWTFLASSSIKTKIAY